MGGSTTPGKFHAFYWTFKDFLAKLASVGKTCGSQHVVYDPKKSTSWTVQLFDQFRTGLLLDVWEGNEREFLFAQVRCLVGDEGALNFNVFCERCKRDNSMPFLLEHSPGQINLFWTQLVRILATTHLHQHESHQVSF